MTTYRAASPRAMRVRPLQAFMFTLAAVGLWLNPNPLQALAEGVLPGLGASFAAAVVAVTVAGAITSVGIYVVDAHADAIRYVGLVLAALLVWIVLFQLFETLWPALHFLWLLVFGGGVIGAVGAALLREDETSFR